MSGLLLVTGGARGIGAAIARLAGSRGWTVAVHYRNSATQAVEVVATVEAGGGRAAAG